jgi:predicted dehydrogenase
MGEALKLGIVGCGNHMFEFLFHALKWAPEHSVVAACDIDAKRLDRFTRVYNVAAGYTDLAEMLAEQKPDAVIVSVGHTENFAIAKAALEAGAHVFLEKTPCRNVAEADELAAIVRRTGKSLMVGFNRRFMTAYVMAHEISQRPEFGGIRMYHSQFHATPYRSDEHLRTNHIIHHLDLARFLMGELTLTHVDRLVIDDRRVGYNINFVAEGGGIGVVQCGSFLDELYPMERLELLGDRRNIVVDNIKGLVYNRPPVTRKETFGQFTLADDGDALVWNPSHGYYPRFSHHGYENELHYFLKCIGTGATPQPGIEDSRKTMALLAQLDTLLAAKSR